jgi:hypothetical protein
VLPALNCTYTHVDTERGSTKTVDERYEVEPGKKLELYNVQKKSKLRALSMGENPSCSGRAHLKVGRGST